MQKATRQGLHVSSPRVSTPSSSGCPWESAWCYVQIVIQIIHEEHMLEFCCMSAGILCPVSHCLLVLRVSCPGYAMCAWQSLQMPWISHPVHALLPIPPHTQ